MSGIWIYGITEVDFGWNFGVVKISERYYNDITTVLQWYYNGINLFANQEEKEGGGIFREFWGLGKMVERRINGENRWNFW